MSEDNLELPAFERPAVDHAAFGASGSDPATHPHADDLGRLRDVPVELAVEIGRTRMTVGATLELRPGSIVVLDRVAGEPVDLLVNGTPIARGEVVVIDEEFALRVTEVLGERPNPVGERPNPAASRTDGPDRAADASASQPDPAAVARGRRR
jgi:flagellar motor switch protein FliN/FliY